MLFRLSGLVLIFLICTPVWACKMTPMGSSAHVIKALINEVQNDEKLDNREIKKIRKIAFKGLAWTYVVETTKDGKVCEALAYEAIIQPSCEIKLKKINTPFHCSKN